MCSEIIKYFKIMTIYQYEFLGDMHFLFNDSSLQSACIGAMILYVSDLCNLNT